MDDPVKEVFAETLDKHRVEIHWDKASPFDDECEFWAECTCDWTSNGKHREHGFEVAWRERNLHLGEILAAKVRDMVGGE